MVFPEELSARQLEELLVRRLQDEQKLLFDGSGSANAMTACVEKEDPKAVRSAQRSACQSGSVVYQWKRW